MSQIVKPSDIESQVAVIYDRSERIEKAVSDLVKRQHDGEVQCATTKQEFGDRLRALENSRPRTRFAAAACTGSGIGGLLWGILEYFKNKA